jgi:hypothetical protein
MQIQGEQPMKSFQNKLMAQRITDTQQGHQNKNRTRKLEWTQPIWHHEDRSTKTQTNLMEKIQRKS